MERVESKITSQGQVSIPAPIRQKLGLTPGSKVEWCVQGDDVIVRRAATPHACRGHRIPAGSVVVASPFVTHRDTRFFPDPLTFSPKRWLGANGRPRLAYFPFGAGPRSCIGEGFAWMEGTLVLATLAGRWRLQSGSGAIEPSPRITLRPRGPVPMVPALVG